MAIVEIISLKRPLKQVNLRLNITDEDGIPVAFKVINGKTGDRTTSESFREYARFA